MARLAWQTSHRKFSESWWQNPLAPFFNNWFPNPYVQYWFELDYRRHMSMYALTSWSQIPLEVTVHGSLLNGLLGPVFLLTPLAFLALRYPEGRRLLLAAVPAASALVSRSKVVVEPHRELLSPLCLLAPRDRAVPDRRPERHSAMDDEVAQEAAGQDADSSTGEEIREVWAPLVLECVVGSLAV